MPRLRKHSRSIRVYAENDAATARISSQSRSTSGKESPETLKLELLRIHHRNRKEKPRRQKRRRRSSRIANGTNDSLVVPRYTMKDASYSYSKNYLKLSKDFVAASKYHVNSRRKTCPTCVKCMTKRSKKVIFPCEHVCLCSACSVPKQCPICKCPVHVVLENADNVIDNYWLWVDEVVESSLTTSFIGCFQLKSYEAINAAIAAQHQLQHQQRKQTENLEHDDESFFQKRRKSSSWMRRFLCPITSCSYYARARSTGAP